MTLEHWGQSFSRSPIPFAQLPPAASVEGRVERLAELPHVSLIALGGIWRPFGGRQVLASRGNNPVTVQDLAGAVAETIGPFPGGLVRAGMQLVLTQEFSHSGISSAARIAAARISGGYISYAPLTNSGADLSGKKRTNLLVRADGSASISRWTGNISYGVGNASASLTVDFSADWSADIFLLSVAETAINITAASWAAGVATFTATAHTLEVGDKTVIAGVTPTGYNIAAGGIVLTAPDANTFTVAIASDPGAYTSGGTSSRISNMISKSYVLELVG